MSARRTSLALASAAASLLLIAPAAIVAQDDAEPSPAAATSEPIPATPEPAATTPEPVAATPLPTEAPAGPVATPETSVLPDLAPRSPTRSAEGICAAASGQLEDGQCLLGRARLGAGPVRRILGSDLETVVLEVGTRPTTATGTPLLDAAAAETVSFVDRVKPSRRERSALENNRKKKGVVNGKKDSWNNVGIIEMPKPWPEDSVDEWLLRLASPGGTLDIGRVGNKDHVTDGRGRQRAGLGFVGDELLTFVVPGGLDPRFVLDLAWIDPSGQTIVQHLGGPGSPDALIPRSGSFAPVLDCGSYVAEIDFDSSTDGQAYDLQQIDLVMATNVLPPDIDPGAFRFDVTLEPAGSRARRSDPVTFEGVEPTRVRRAIAMTLDLRAEMLTGPTGYQLFEQPYVIGSIESSVDPSSLPYDPEQAIALLEEAGWVDADGDGIHEATHDALTSEFSRHASFDHTADPLTWGDVACDRDSQFLAAAEVCEIPHAAFAAELWERSFGEPVAELDLRRGFFPGDLFGCTVLGPDEQLLSIFATSPRFGVDESLLPGSLAWTEQLECDIDEAALGALPPVGAEEPVQVADCETADYSLWADRGFGGLTYVLLPGRDEDVDEVTALLRTLDSADLDGDGTPDRHDLDLDGDGTPDLDDEDDDGDGVSDPIDHNERDARVTVSPAREATALAMEDILRGE